MRVFVLLHFVYRIVTIYSGRKFCFVKKIKRSIERFLLKFNKKEHEEHHKKEKAFLGNHKHRKFRPLYFLIILFLLFFVGTSFAQAPMHELIWKFNKPKTISESNQTLSQSTQKAIEELAREQIQEQQVTALLPNTIAFTTSDNASGQGVQNTVTSEQSSGNSLATQKTTQGNLGIVQLITETLQETFTKDPAIKARIELNRINRLIVRVQNLLEKDRPARNATQRVAGGSDKAVTEAVSIIKTIGQETGKLMTDPSIQKDREILGQQIAQYNKLQLILQKIEDTLPIEAYLQVEDARVTFLVSGAQASLNAAPNLDVTHNVAIKELAKQVGKDFAELKAIEVLTDIGSGLKPEAKQKLAGLQKQLALQFEKRMLTLPHDVRNRKMQDYINLSHGNPLNQIRSFNQMQHFLTDREMILQTEGLKELALKKLEKRLFELTTPELEDKFNAKVLTDPEDIKTLILAQLDIEAGTDESKKKIIDQLSQRGQQSAIRIFGKDKNILSGAFTQTDNPDLLDVVLVTRIEKILGNASEVAPEIKQTIRGIKQKTMQGFVNNISKKDFATPLRHGYNPVSQHADVRSLLSSPQSFLLLEGIKNELPEKDKSKIILAEKANVALVTHHLLEDVQDPEIFDRYHHFITINPQIKQVLQRYNNQNLFTALDKKKEILDEQAKKNEQKLYETMQQITQKIFTTPDNTLSDEEQQLPEQVQKDIQTVKESLPDNTVPKLETPAGVQLTEVAILPSDVQAAIVAAAKTQLDQKEQTVETKLDLTTEAKNMGVSVPTILPDNPLYPIVEAVRTVTLILKTDPVDRAQELIKQDNEKTLEAAALLEENQSTSTIETVIDTFDSVKEDFEKLKQHADQLQPLSQTEPAKVENLVSEVITGGIVRETIISAIENTIHGEQYVAVEEIRQDILKDGVDALLAVTNNNVKQLTDELEKVVMQNTETSTATVAAEIKAVELLNEIARTQPESAQEILQASEKTIAANLEQTLLAQSPEQREQELVSYAEQATGNPVRQVEAAEILKDNFTSPQIILLTETLKEIATQNLKERISELPDATTREEFADQVIGSEPQDLKAIIEIASEVAPTQDAGVVEVLPIVQQLEDIKANIEQNIVEAYKDNPEALKNADFFDNPTLSKTPDIVDIQVAQEIINILSASPEVQPQVIEVAKQEETKIIDTFVENVSNPNFYVTASAQTSSSGETSGSVETHSANSGQANITQLAAETLNTSPETLVQLIELKAKLPLTEQVKIDNVIKMEVTLIQDHLLNHVTDPETFQTYVAQITEDSIIAHIVEQVGGQAFQQAVEQKIQTIQQEAVQEQAKLEITIAQVQEEIFSTPPGQPSAVEQTLPQSVQEEIEHIKQEVPVEQIPAVIVTVQTEVQVTVTAPEPAKQETPATPVESKPAEPAPAVEAPAAPAL